METTTNFTEMVRGIIADAYDAQNIGEWQALFNWYDETNSDKAPHDTFADILNTRVIEAMTKIYKEIEKETRDADEQARWETRYWHERDYGGRL
jgi:hypothetical protein